MQSCAVHHSKSGLSFVLLLHRNLLTGSQSRAATWLSMVTAPSRTLLLMGEEEEVEIEQRGAERRRDQTHTVMSRKKCTL